MAKSVNVPYSCWCDALCGPCVAASVPSMAIEWLFEMQKRTGERTGNVQAADMRAQSEQPAQSGNARSKGSAPHHSSPKNACSTPGCTKKAGKVNEQQEKFMNTFLKQLGLSPEDRGALNPGPGIPTPLPPPLYASPPLLPGLRPVHVWLPHLQLPAKAELSKLRCPSEGCGGEVACKQVMPFVPVDGLDNEYLVYCQYACKKTDGKRIQHTFLSTSEADMLLAGVPAAVMAMCPVVQFHHSYMTRQLIRLALHFGYHGSFQSVVQYVRQHRTHLWMNQRALYGEKAVGEFGDHCRNNGTYGPSASRYTNVFKLYYELMKETWARFQQQIGGKYLRYDHHYGVTSRMRASGSKGAGNDSYTPVPTVFCVVNEFGQVVGHVFAPGSGAVHLGQLAKSLSERDGIDVERVIVWGDKCCSEAAWLTKTHFPNVRVMLDLHHLLTRYREAVPGAVAMAAIMSGIARVLAGTREERKIVRDGEQAYNEVSALFRHHLDNGTLSRKQYDDLMAKHLSQRSHYLNCIAVPEVVPFDLVVHNRYGRESLVRGTNC